ncbi:succinic semialdehyde dehydrogenase [Micromonospora mirobrigensis]|uniref:Succinate-semialdehyde dehydrogenase / glutarate-semialdehyde dehydrogenase n=1 Tax=Micromonospora mirobrigensis TaxID=262898 RepID=A0A1C4ZRH5_9ACTN|nr:succinic semialdehyde dehydrogenase [Micromonospora mirobrigensis]SCF35575.1 succinate-semialdehyde dehydrogenase / glutarate-semialdehyde dehydrogenase [Micromonospora mirobrigensis]
MTVTATPVEGNPAVAGTPPALPATATALVGQVRGTGPAFTATSPLTGERTVDVPSSTAADLDAAFADARTAQRAWATLPASRRTRFLLRLHDLVLDRQAEGLDLIQLEAGKARRHAVEEILDVAINARYHARRTAKLLRPRRRAGALPVLTRAHELRFPVGVVGVISPWNYPLSLAVAEVLPALAAGNAVVHRPDPATMLTALWVRDLAVTAGLPAALWQVVAGEGADVGPLVTDRADLVCFTGSTRVGREVAARAAHRLVPTSLELGGKNPLLVLDDADLDRAVEGAIRACFASAGQLCVSIERVYVADKLHDEFLRRFVARTGALRLGVGGDFDADLGSLASARQLDTVTAHVTDAVARGATLHTGGRHRPDIGPYVFEPTVLTGVTPQMRMFAEETFGPVVAVYRFGTDDEAVALANDTAYGLNASVFSGSGRRGEAVAARIDAGGVNVDDGYSAVWGSVDAPMGGWKDSGLGGRHGADGLLRFTRVKTVARQRGPALAPAYHRPAAETAAWTRRMTAALRLLRRTGR